VTTAYLAQQTACTVVCVRITGDDIRRFQEIWREEFAEEITADEAREHITRLDALYLMLARPPLGEQEPVPLRSEVTQHQ
jgi:hypothetical protein